MTVRSKTTLTGTTELDMRVSSLVGEELAKEIVASVERSQLFIQQTLPDRLVLTMEQFNSLIKSMDDMYQTTDKLYRTPLNVMEVEVKDE